jgi:hypothetical protein
MVLVHGLAWVHDVGWAVRQLLLVHAADRRCVCFLLQVDRFEIGCAETRKKFSMMAPPEVSIPDLGGPGVAGLLRTAE